jgi:hypothetical protein
VQSFIKYHNWNTDLYRSGARLWGLVTPFQVTQDSFVQISGYVNIKHKGNPNVVVGISSRVGIRIAESLSDFDNTTLFPAGTQPGSWNTSGFTWINGAKDGKNILSVTQHYESLSLSVALYLSAGVYRIEPYLFEMSDAAPNVDGITCVNVDTNQAENDTFGYLSVIITTIDGD